MFSWLLSITKVAGSNLRIGQRYTVPQVSSFVLMYPRKLSTILSALDFVHAIFVCFFGKQHSWVETTNKPRKNLKPE